jgi:hypothetical protein
MLDEPRKMVWTRAVCCPDCLGRSLQSQRSKKQPDGSRIKPTRCRLCECRFDVIVLPPDPNFGFLEEA